MFPCSGSSSPPLMIHLVYALLATARSSLRSQRELALENLALRQQLAVLKHATKRPALCYADRAFWVALSWVWPDWHNALILVKSETVIRWHRKGFRNIDEGKVIALPMVGGLHHRYTRRAA